MSLFIPERIFFKKRSMRFLTWYPISSNASNESKWLYVSWSFFIPLSKANGPKFATISEESQHENFSKFSYDHMVEPPRPKTTNGFPNVSTPSTMVNVIPTRTSVRKRKPARSKLPHTHRNLIFVNTINQGPTKPKQIPQCFVVNARSIVKPDAYPALYAELNSNNIDLCCISETSLHPTIPLRKIHTYFHMWNRNFIYERMNFIYEIRISHVKSKSHMWIKLFHIWNLAIHMWKVICEIWSHVNFSFHIWICLCEIKSHMKSYVWKRITY